MRCWGQAIGRFASPDAVLVLLFDALRTEQMVCLRTIAVSDPIGDRMVC
jgi:hypothetical protein